MVGKEGTASTGIRVLVIDDSPYNRKVIREVLQGMEGVGEVQTASNGEEAIRAVLRDPPEVITLDLNMPRMDGFTFLRWLMKNRPLPVVVVSSEGGERNVFKALDLGAMDFVVKPVHYASDKILEIGGELREKIEAVAGRDPSRFLNRAEVRRGREKPQPSLAEVPVLPAQRQGLLVVGASTGGPSAVQRVLMELDADYPFPVIVVQHMPPVFTNQFAQRLERNTSLKCKEAEDVDRLLPGRILVVPGGFHLSLRGGVNRLVRVVPRKEGDRFVPSVDVTMTSVAHAFGPSAIGVLLTGMGNDGARGMLDIRNAGGITIAESEESAVVFGMPRAAVQMGAAQEVLPLERIGERILHFTRALTSLKNARSDDTN